MELVDYKITEGSDYWPQGNFDGKNLYLLSSWNGDQDGWSFSIGFDPTDQRVYVVEACDYKRKRAYRMSDPDLTLSKEAWDDVDYVDLEIDEDFVAKAKWIKTDQDYDTRVSVPLELPDDAMFELMKQAHEQDITLNELVENILRKFVDQEKIKAHLSDDEYWDKLAEDNWDDDHFEDRGIWNEPFESESPKKKKKSKKERR